MSARRVPLGELCEMDRQGIPPDDPLTAELPFVGVENVVGGTGLLNFDTDSRIGGQKSTAFRFDQRHVLYGKLRPYLNKVAVPDFAGRCSTELVPLLPCNGVGRDFLAHLLRRKETVDFVMASVTGARMPRTDMKVLMSMPVRLPPLDEQRRIAAILNRAARIENLCTRANKYLRDFIPALFVRMFGDPIENPKGWSIKPLKYAYILAQYGTSKKADEQPGGIPVLRMGNVAYDGDLDCTDLKYVTLSDAEIEKYALCTGDLLFNRTNSKELVGKTGIWDGRFKAVAASYFIRLRLDKSIVCPEYVWAFMNSHTMKRHLFNMARGAIGQANINAKELKSLPLPVPPIDLQRRYAEIIGRVRDTTAAMELSSATVSTLNTSLMTHLFGDFR